MTNNQVMSKVLNTPLKRQLAVGAASLLATGALIGVGATGAVAATPHATPAATASVSASASPTPGPDNSWGGSAGLSAGGSASIASLGNELGQAFFNGRIDGAAAQRVASRLVADQAVFSTLPAALQSDLTALKNAPAAERVADAQKIASTALDGGYGHAIKGLATAIENAPKARINASLVRELQADLSSGQSAGQTAAKVAGTLAGQEKLFAELPSKLQSDLTALKNAPVADQTADALKIETTALSGGYGAQIEKVAEGIQSAVSALGSAGATGSITSDGAAG